VSKRRAAAVGLVLALGLPWPGTARAGRSIVPIPEIILDPNEGNTLGVLGVVLFTDDETDRIRYMLAPDVRYNETTGIYPHFRLFGYPTPTRQYALVAAKSTTRDENYEIEFEDRGYWEERAFLLANVGYERDSTERFFGFGNDSLETNESNYTGQVFRAEAVPGVWVLPYLNLSYRMGILRHGVQPGQVSSIPFIGARRFIEGPDTDVRNRGLETAVYWSHGVALTYDSRDSLRTPTRGTLALLYATAADQRLGSATSYVKFGAESRKFIPFREAENPVLALRALLDYVSGSDDTPFYEMSSLGGRKSLRAFGGDRFIDFNRSLASAELRTRVYRRKLFGVNAELELAPFVESGQVFHSLSDSPVDDLHWAYGLGFRGVVRPQIVAFVDVGRGSEGTSIFSGIDYPF
jgi:outer membrane protein assembly factor BamA